MPDVPDPHAVCDRCGERLGVYEPLVLELSDGTVLRGGLAGGAQEVAARS